MTPLPGESRGGAHPRDRPDAAARRRRAVSARQFLAALLLAVLTVAGGAPAAAGAGLPARPAAGPASLGAHDIQGAHDVPRGRTRAAAGSLRPGPETVPQPWVAAEHPRPPQHLPPPGPGSPLPSPPGLPLPHPVPGCTLTGPPAAADRFRTALPGVRGPPGTAFNRPWDPSPVPSRTPAAAP
ncbi:hypothetical protein AB0I52_22940 [Streptomyces sp. NPDC050423]|uniref:hypothetical protein n=1 Tax=Streptomyces sp. NPDC050423 TaxID=3155402 RepID=UPI00343E51C2